MVVETRKKTSSNVAKTALGLSIGALGVQALSGGTNPLGNLFGNNAPSATAATEAAMLAPVLINAATGAYANRSCDCYVTEKEMTLIRESAGKDAVIGRLEGEKYTDNKITLSLAPVYGELSKQKDEICELKSALAMETERRACGDRNLQTYVDGNFIKAEKSINSKHINYHGCEPMIRPVHDCCCDN